MSPPRPVEGATGAGIRGLGKLLWEGVGRLAPQSKQEVAGETENMFTCRKKNLDGGQIAREAIKT